MIWWTEKEERTVSEGFILASKERVSAASFNRAEVPSLNREGWANSSASDIWWMSEESISSRAFLQMSSSRVSEYKVFPNQNPDVSETDLSWLSIPTFLELWASNDLSLSQCHLPAESCNLQKWICLGILTVACLWLQISYGRCGLGMIVMVDSEHSHWVHVKHASYRGRVK